MKRCPAGNRVETDDALVFWRAAIVVLGKYSGAYKATGKSFQADFAHVWNIREGKAIRFVQHVDTLLVHRALTD